MPGVRKLFYKINKWLLKRSYPAQLLVFLLASYVILLLFIPIFFALELSGLSTTGGEPDISIKDLLLVAVIAPIAETFVFQYLVLRLTMYFTKQRKYYPIAIVVSSILFGLAHTYNVAYVFFAFFIGLVLAYMYYFYAKNPKRAFWSVALVHGIRNGLSLVLALLFGFK